MFNWFKKKKRTFKLNASEIKPLIENMGGCIASDMITVDGKKVKYMYRNEPMNEVDSGWQFLSGHESEEYTNNPDNHEFYNVNTICNYDPDIIPYLNTPAPCAFERTQDGFVQFEFEHCE